MTVAEGECYYDLVRARIYDTLIDRLPVIETADYVKWIFLRIRHSERDLDIDACMAQLRPLIIGERTYVDDYSDQNVADSAAHHQLANHVRYSRHMDCIRVDKPFLVYFADFQVYLCHEDNVAPTRYPIT